MQDETETPKEWEVAENYPKEGEALLARKAVVGINESIQWRSLFNIV